MNIANIPNPNSKAARFVLHTAGIRIIFMSTMGVFERVSERIQHGINTAVAANSPSTEVLLHPHIGPYEIANRPVISQADIIEAPTQLTRPGDRTGDSGTNR